MKELKLKRKVLLGILFLFGFGFLVGMGLSKLVKRTELGMEACTLKGKLSVSARTIN